MTTSTTLDELVKFSNECQSNTVITSHSDSSPGLFTFIYGCNVRETCFRLHGSRQTFTTDKPCILDWQIIFNDYNEFQIQLLSSERRDVLVNAECFLGLSDSTLQRFTENSKFDMTYRFPIVKIIKAKKLHFADYDLNEEDARYHYTYAGDDDTPGYVDFAKVVVRLIITVQELESLTEQMQCKNSENSLSKNLETILTDGRLSDVTFVIGEKQFKAHRLILSARSPVFASMFEHDMLEKQSKSIPLADVEPSVFEAFLHFIYTDEKPNVDSDKLCALLVVADRYDVKGLKEVCEYIIPKKLCADNAADILVLSFALHAEYLKEKAIDFVVRNKNKIADTPAFQSMIKTYPDLALEIIKRLDCKKQ